MKITAIETLRLEEFGNLLWVFVETDEGLAGLGETFFGPQAVESPNLMLSPRWLHPTICPLPHDCTGPVIYTAATHMSVHEPNGSSQESVRAFYDGGWYTEVATSLPIMKNGYVRPPEGPGLGMGTAA